MWFGREITVTGRKSGWYRHEYGEVLMGPVLSREYCDPRMEELDFSAHQDMRLFIREQERCLHRRRMMRLPKRTRHRIARSGGLTRWRNGMDFERLECPRCHSRSTHHNGHNKRALQRWMCVGCKRTFYGESV